MIFARLADWWISRRARPEPGAIKAAASLRPAIAITGASRGIGFEIAKQFAAPDRAVLLIARDSDELALAAQKLSAAKSGAKVLSLSLDVTCLDAGEEIDKALAAEGCYLDILVNNAGFGLSGDFSDQPPERIDQLVALNIAAVTRLTRHALPGMLARGRGGILNIASLAGLMPGPYQAAYYASKAYVVSLTRAVAAETAGRGVRICSALPGPVETSIHADMGANNALYRYVMPSLTPDAAARSIYRGYSLGHALIVPGIGNFLVSRFVSFVPYALLVPVVGLLLWPGQQSRAKPRPGENAKQDLQNEKVP